MNRTLFDENGAAELLPAAINERSMPLVEPPNPNMVRVTLEHQMDGVRAPARHLVTFATAIAPVQIGPQQGYIFLGHAYDNLSEEITVSWQRLEAGDFGIEKGDIWGSICTDFPKRIRPVVVEGRIYSISGGCTRSVAAYELVPAPPAVPFDLPALPNSVKPISDGRYVGKLVRFKQRSYVVSRRVEIKGSEETLDELRERNRRDFALGGWFALEHSRYHGFLRCLASNTRVMTTVDGRPSPFCDDARVARLLHAIDLDLSGPDYTHATIMDLVPVPKGKSRAGMAKQSRKERNESDGDAEPQRQQKAENQPKAWSQLTLF